MYSHDADIPEITYYHIGKRGVPRIDGYAKASGRAVYTRDVQIPGMLYARVMRSPYAHARIISMDTTKAESLPGVRAIMRYDDPEIKGRRLNGSVGGPDRMAPQFSGFALKPESVILAQEAWFEGQAVGAMVAAESEEITNEALRLIDVEWEELPFVLDEEEALNPDAPVLLPNATSNRLEKFGAFFEMGDVEKGFKEADKIVEFRAHRRAHLWAGAEMPSVLARWIGDDRLELWVHVQQPYPVKLLLSEQLNIPMNKITMYTPYQGCSFGERCNPADFSINGMNVLAVLMAKKTKRPVKLLFNRAEKFYGESVDMMTSYIKVGAKNDGTITAVDMKNIFGVFMCCPGIEHFVENTRIPNLRCEAITTDVSKAPAWWDRCEQLPNSFCFTLVFDRVAAELNLDPTEVALKNDGCNGHGMDWLSKYKREHGFPDRDSLRECIEAGKKAIDWDNKWHPPGTKRLPNGRMHGIAFTWDHEWDDVRGTGSAAVWIENDGTVSIVAQHSDIGVNPWTAYCQIVADELGVPVENVTIKPFDGDQMFALMSPDGSCNLCSNGFIVRKAARKARAMLLDLALNFFDGLNVEDLDIKDGFVFEKRNPDNKKPIKDIALLAMPMHNAVGTWTEPPLMGWAWHQQGLWNEALETGRPRLCRQAHFMEVEVDTETGEVVVTKVVNVNDVGKAISPETVEGQMYGGTYMGVSRALTEEMVWDPQTGVLLNRNLLDYKVATIKDCPGADTIIVETQMGHGPYGAVGVGEDIATVIPALLAPAVYNAIGKWIYDFPITPDKILKA
ncbi:MAG: xanthine dehydrogenase family protein molybdopterin-binding subunit, partial [Deltaproteobacteria bacterium]|nr:xanthine dehydrogenase family protein molybdopterin-binding subunit [Deltaproteobacteria bacterium]